MKEVVIMIYDDKFDPSELKGVVIANHDSEFLAAIAKLKKIQMLESYSHEIEALQIDEIDYILFDPFDPQVSIMWIGWKKMNDETKAKSLSKIEALCLFKC